MMEPAQSRILGWPYDCVSPILGPQLDAHISCVLVILQVCQSHPILWVVVGGTTQAPPVYKWVTPLRAPLSAVVAGVGGRACLGPGARLVLVGVCVGLAPHGGGWVGGRLAMGWLRDVRGLWLAVCG